jgi:hypothetical protein
MKEERRQCAICAADLPEGALFCGECGSSVHATPRSRQRTVDIRPSDTVVIDPAALRAALHETIRPVARLERRSSREAVDAVSSHRAEAAENSDVQDGPSAGGPSEKSDDFRLTPAWLHAVEAKSSRGGEAPLSPPHDRAAAPSEADEERRDEESPDDRADGPVFEMRVSTGERIDVSGTGLLGRRPIPREGETFDQLIALRDTTRSVSKTHLEFGHEDGEFWVVDRFSSNGTVLRRQREAPLLLEPGRRYRVPRGARIELGDQWVDLR